MLFTYVYILLGIHSKRLYIGMTADLCQKVCLHMRGEVVSTRDHLPMVLLHYESFQSKRDAHYRKRFLISTSGTEELTRLLRHALCKYRYFQ